MSPYLCTTEGIVDEASFSDVSEDSPVTQRPRPFDAIQDSAIVIRANRKPVLIHPSQELDRGAPIRLPIEKEPCTCSRRVRLESARRLLDRLVKVPCFFLFSRPPSAPGLVFRHYSAQPPLLIDNPHGSAIGLQRIGGYDLETSSRLAHIANDPESFGTLSIDQVQAAAIHRDQHVRLGLTITCNRKTDAGHQSLASNRSIL